MMNATSHTVQPVDSADWIPVGEAARLVPSPRSGKRTAIATIVRWILTGKLTGWKRGRWWFVRRSEVLCVGMPSPVASAPPLPELPRGRTASQHDAAQAWAQKVLAG